MTALRAAVASTACGQADGAGILVQVKTSAGCPLWHHAATRTHQPCQRRTGSLSFPPTITATTASAAPMMVSRAARSNGDSHSKPSR